MALGTFPGASRPRSHMFWGGNDLFRRSCPYPKRCNSECMDPPRDMVRTCSDSVHCCGSGPGALDRMGRPTLIYAQYPTFGIYSCSRDRGGDSCRCEKLDSDWIIQFPAIRDREDCDYPVSSKILITEEGPTQFSSGSSASCTLGWASTDTRHAPTRLGYRDGVWGDPFRDALLGGYPSDPASPYSQSCPWPNAFL